MPIRSIYIDNTNNHIWIPGRPLAEVHTSPTPKGSNFLINPQDLTTEYLRGLLTAKRTVLLANPQPTGIITNPNTEVKIPDQTELNDDSLNRRNVSFVNYDAFFDAIIDKIKDLNDKERAKKYFEHLSGCYANDYFLYRDRESWEPDGVRHLARFNAIDAAIEVDNLTSNLIINLKNPEISQLSRNSSLKLLYHGFSFIEGMDWSKHIDNLKDLLNSKDAIIRLFTEQSLKVIESSITAEQAQAMLVHLGSHGRLAGDLSQILFIKFSELKAQHTTDSLVADLKSLSTMEITQNLSTLIKRAMNQSDTALVSTGNVGIEVELKLKGVCQKRSADDSIMVNIFNNNDDIASLVSLGVDGLLGVAEIRSGKGGFKLNADSRATLLKLGSRLQGSEDLCRFRSIHINVDTPFRNKMRLLKYRRDSEHYWENTSCPIPVVKLPMVTQLTSARSRVELSSINDGYIPYAIDVSAMLDQILMIDCFRTHEPLIPTDSALKEILRGEEIGSWYQNSPQSNEHQRITAKVLIYLAKKNGEEHIIPSILRLCESCSLPVLGQESKNIVGGFILISANNPEESLSGLAKSDRTKAISSIRHVLRDGFYIPFDDTVNSFIQSGSTCFESIIDDLEFLDFNDSRVKFLLQNPDISIANRSKIAHKLRRFSVPEDISFFEDTNIPWLIRVDVFTRMNCDGSDKTAKVAATLREEDLSNTLASIDTNERMPFSSQIKELLLSNFQTQKHSDSAYCQIEFNDDSRRILMSEGLSNWSIEMLNSKIKIDTIDDKLNLYLQSLVNNGSDSAIHALLRRVADYCWTLTEIEFDPIINKLLELSSTCDNQVTSIILSKLVAYDLNDESAQSFLRNQSIPTESRVSYAKNFHTQLDSDTEQFLLDESIDKHIRIAIARNMSIDLDHHLLNLYKGIDSGSPIIGAINQAVQLHCGQIGVIPLTEVTLELFKLLSKPYKDNTIPVGLDLVARLQTESSSDPVRQEFFTSDLIGELFKYRCIDKLARRFNVEVVNLLLNESIPLDLRSDLAEKVNFNGIDENVIRFFKETKSKELARLIDRRLAQYYSSRHTPRYLSQKIVDFYGQLGTTDHGMLTMSVLIGQLIVTGTDVDLAKSFIDNPDIPIKFKSPLALELSRLTASNNDTLYTSYNSNAN